MVEAPMESVSKSDTAKRTSEGPNIITNAEEGPRAAPINSEPSCRPKNSSASTRMSDSRSTSLREKSPTGTTFFTHSLSKVSEPLRRLISRAFLGQIYLPERRYCTMEYLRAILNGRKRYFKNEQARKVRVPRFR